MSTFFNIAHGIRLLEDTNNFPWPYDIALCFEQVDYPIAFSEGVAHGAGGCAVSASTAISSTWREHFEITNALWLIPYIERLAAGIPLPRDEIINHFFAVHGKLPSSYESWTA